MGIRRQIALARASLNFAACYHRSSGVRTLIARVLGLVLCLICRAIVPVKSGMILKDPLCFHHIALSRNAGEQPQKKCQCQASKNGTAVGTCCLMPNISICLMSANFNVTLRAQESIGASIDSNVVPVKLC